MAGGSVAACRGLGGSPQAASTVRGGRLSPAGKEGAALLALRLLPTFGCAPVRVPGRSGEIAVPPQEREAAREVAARAFEAAERAKRAAAAAAARGQGQTPRRPWEREEEAAAEAARAVAARGARAAAACSAFEATGEAAVEAAEEEQLEEEAAAEEVEEEELEADLQPVEEVAAEAMVEGAEGGGRLEAAPLYRVTEADGARRIGGGADAAAAAAEEEEAEAAEATEATEATEEGRGELRLVCVSDTHGFELPSRVPRSAALPYPSTLLPASGRHLPPTPLAAVTCCCIVVTGRPRATGRTRRAAPRPSTNGSPRRRAISTDLRRSRLASAHRGGSHQYYLALPFRGPLPTALPPWSQPHPTKIVLRGNHDPHDASFPLSKALYYTAPASLTAAGVTFALVPFMRRGSPLRERGLPSGEILATHLPPKQVLDRCEPPWHRGTTPLAARPHAPTFRAHLPTPPLPSPSPSGAPRASAAAPPRCAPPCAARPPSRASGSAATSTRRAAPRARASAAAPSARRSW